jgi:flagellar biosynthesis/type III secretory pathway protein FliH
MARRVRENEKVAPEERQKTMINLRLQFRLRDYMKKALLEAEKSNVEVNKWEEEEMETAYEAGYHAGFQDSETQHLRKTLDQFETEQ